MEDYQNEQDYYNQARAEAYKLMVSEGYSSSLTTQILFNEGYDYNLVNDVVKEIILEIKEEKREQALEDLKWGLVWCAGGITATWLSYETASSDGRFLIFHGAVIYGGYRILKGLWKRFRE